MKKLRTEFNKNDMKYIQVKRTKTVAMYQLKSIESGASAGYEAWDIPIQKAASTTIADGVTVSFEEKERPPKNSEFGILYRSKALINIKLAERYYKLLTNTEPNSDEFKTGFKEIGLI